MLQHCNFPRRNIMKIRALIAGLVLAVAIAPTAAAAPKTAPQPVGGSATEVSTNFICPIFPWLAMCHPR